MNRSTLIFALLLIVSPLVVSADIITVRTQVDEAGHVLDGATLSQSFDVSTWNSTTSSVPRVNAGSTTSTSEISGATGAGAIWNGTYVGAPETANQTNLGFQLVNGMTPFARLVSTAAHPLFGSSGNINYTDGTKAWVMRVDIDLGPVPITVGSLVVEDNFGMVSSSANIRHVFGGTAFTTNPGLNGGTVTFTSAAVPEPSSFAILGLGGLAFVGYRRRKLKQAA